MLDFITKRKERKLQKQVEEFIDDGLNKITHKLYKQGMICFNNAIILNVEYVVDILSKHFQSYFQMGDWDSALSIGLVLLQVNKKNFELANRVGNCARKLHNFQQANNLYRLSLRGNKKYREAFYNLAASMGKVSYFDLDVKFVIDKHIKDTNFILPDFIDDADFINDIKLQLIKRYDERIQNELKKDSHTNKHKETITEYVPDYEEILEEVSLLLDNSADDIKSEVGNKKYYNTLYNKGLYALENNDFDTAFDAFVTIKQANIEIEYLEMLLAILLHHRAKSDQAIDMMIRLLGQDQYNRFLNVNLGLMYQKLGNHLLSIKYLVIGASLLEKSEGLYRISDLMNIAIEHFDNGLNRKSLSLFKIVVSEQRNVKAWSYIGEIHLQIKNYAEAIKAFKEIIQIDPKSDLGHSRLKDIHDLFYEKGINAQIEKKPRTAAGYYVKAIQVVENVETYEKAIRIYQDIKDMEQAQKLQTRLDEIKQKEKDQRLEKFRQDYIHRGKIFVKNHKFEEAIQNLEQAFRMKIDKDVFMYLAQIYKRLNKTKSLANLLKRWEVMQDMEEKMKQRERGLARAKKVEEER